MVVRPLVEASPWTAARSHGNAHGGRGQQRSVGGKHTTATTGDTSIIVSVLPSLSKMQNELLYEPVRR
jgi:hypothetical protein